MSQTFDSAQRTESIPRTTTGPLMLAVDGAPCEHLVRAARVLAPRFANKVHVVSVVEPLPTEVFESQPLLGGRGPDDPRIRARAEQISATLRSVLGPDHGWEITVVHGDVARLLSGQVRMLHAQLVITGIGRHRPIDRLLANETTLHVIRHAPCAVFAVSEEFDHLPREVVVATDFSAQSALAAEAALPLLDSNATLHFVHVWEPSTPARAAVREIERAYRAGLPARFDRFVGALAIPADVTTTFDVREGKTAQRLLEVAAGYGADLIVAGRYGMNPLARLVVGSVTTALLRGATQAVLVTPPPTPRNLNRMQRALRNGAGDEIEENWQSELSEFANRNRGRRSQLEVDDPSFGAQMQETGYRFADASFDPRDATVQLMFGGLHAGAPHLTRTIHGVDGIALFRDTDGRDVTLRVSHGTSQTLLIFENGA